MIKYTEEQIFCGIIKNDKLIIGSIYWQYKSRVIAIGLKFNNFELNVEEIYDDAFIDLIDNIKKCKFKMNSSIFTYFVRIFLNKCLAELKIILRNRDRNEDYTKHILIAKSEFSDYIDIENFEIEIEQEVHRNNKKKQWKELLKLFEELDERCKKILKLKLGLDEDLLHFEPIIDEMTHEEVANIMGMTAVNERKKFSRCLKALIDSVLGNSELAMLLKGILSNKY
jgi:RNA polymerase sigma factor (sigma-70 family)